MHMWHVCARHQNQRKALRLHQHAMLIAQKIYAIQSIVKALIRIHIHTHTRTLILRENYWGNQVINGVEVVILIRIRIGRMIILYVLHWEWKWILWNVVIPVNKCTVVIVEIMDNVYLPV